MDDRVENRIKDGETDIKKEGEMRWGRKAGREKEGEWG